MTRGFLFTYDAAFGLCMALAVSAACLHHVQGAGGYGSRHEELVRSAVDIGLSLDRSGVLSSADVAIESELNLTCPRNYATSVVVGRYLPENGSFRLLETRRFGGELSGDRAYSRTLSYSKGRLYVVDVGVGLR